MRNLRFGPDQVRADGIARVADQLGGRLNLARSSARASAAAKIKITMLDRPE